MNPHDKTWRQQRKPGLLRLVRIAMKEYFHPARALLRSLRSSTPKQLELDLTGIPRYEVPPQGSKLEFSEWMAKQ